MPQEENLGQKLVRTRSELELAALEKVTEALAEKKHVTALEWAKVAAELRRN